MECRKKRKRIQRLLDGELRPAAAAKLHAHMERCAGCRSYLEQMVTLKNAAGVRRLEGRSDSYWRSYWPRLKPRLAEKPQRRAARVVRIVGNPAFEMAALCAVVFVVMVQFNMFVFQESAVAPAASGVVSPLCSPAAYRHVMGVAGGRPRVTDERLDRVVDSGRRIPHEYVLAPAHGAGAALAGSIAT